MTAAWGPPRITETTAPTIARGDTVTPTDPTPYTPTDMEARDFLIDFLTEASATPRPLSVAEAIADRWFAAHDARARAEQQEVDLAMHHAYRPEVVAEVAVCLDDDADWERIATWCGARIDTTQDPSGEYTSALVLPDGQYGWQGAWIAKRLDGTFAVRAEVEAPDADTLARVRAEAVAPVLALHAPREEQVVIGDCASEDDESELRPADLVGQIVYTPVTATVEYGLEMSEDGEVTHVVRAVNRALAERMHAAQEPSTARIVRRVSSTPWIPEEES